MTNSTLKKILRFVAPPAFIWILKFIFRKNTPWHGDYNSWEDAEKQCPDWDREHVANKIKNSLLKVKRGEAAYERDSCIFSTVEYSWPLIAGLLLASAKCSDQLNVLDFGGSLGSTFYQNKLFLNQLEQVQWNIVEQKHLVDCGKKYFEDSHLRFYERIEDCLNDNQINVLLCSGVLQFIKDPFKLINSLLINNIDYIIIDRTGFLNKRNHRLTLQTVPPSICRSKFPCWFFNEDLFLSYFKSTYDLLFDFTCQFDPITSIDLRTIVKFKGFFFKKK